MFNRIRITNFKSLADTTVELGPFTVLVGANGSGKSSFLQAIELISWTVRSTSINQALQDNFVEFRDLVHLHSSSVSIGFEADLTVDHIDDAEGGKRSQSVSFDIQLAKRKYAYVKSESVMPSEWNGSDDPPFGIVSEKRSRIAVENSRISHENVSLGHSMLLDVFQSRNARSEYPVLYQVASHFANYVHYEIWGPEGLRKPSQARLGPGTKRLGKSGENLPGLLRRIRLDVERWKALLSDLHETFPHIAEIVFKRGIDPGVIGLLFTDTSGKSSIQYRPSQMSDGFMRLLALLAIKHQPQPLSLLGYEEPENGLHPSALDDCMRHLKAIARNGTQVIITTHSPYLLNHLLEDQSEPRAELKLVIRDKKSGNTTITPPDPEKIELARKQGFGVGELWGMLLDEKELAKKR